MLGLKTLIAGYRTRLYVLHPIVKIWIKLPVRSSFMLQESLFCEQTMEKGDFGQWYSKLKTLLKFAM